MGYNGFTRDCIFGAMQAFGGATEASIGTALLGACAPVGYSMIVHGADHLAAGSYTAITGNPWKTATTQLLEKSGLSSETAASFDSKLHSAASNVAGGGLNLLGKQTVTLTKQVSRFFTQNNYKKNLAKLTGKSPSGKEFEAHHVLPQKFRKKFAEKGINIDDPRYLAWWAPAIHKSSARDYNNRWQVFLEGNPNQEQILEFGKKIMSEYGIKTNY